MDLRHNQIKVNENIFRKVLLKVDTLNSENQIYTLQSDVSFEDSRTYIIVTEVKLLPSHFVSCKIQNLMV